MPCGTRRSAATSSTVSTFRRVYLWYDYTDQSDIAWDRTGDRGKTLLFTTWHIMQRRWPPSSLDCSRLQINCIVPASRSAAVETQTTLER